MTDLGPVAEDAVVTDERLAGHATAVTIADLYAVADVAVIGARLSRAHEAVVRARAGSVAEVLQGAITGSVSAACTGRRVIRLARSRAVAGIGVIALGVAGVAAGFSRSDEAVIRARTGTVAEIL
jgi:hypothetical protein